MANPGRYRADHIGSLLRPEELAALPAHAPAAQRREVSDRAVERAVILQRELGLNIVSDGELRRTSPTSMLEATGAARLNIEEEIQFLKGMLGSSTGGAGVPFKITLPTPSALPPPLASAWRRAIDACLAGGIQYIQLENNAYAQHLNPGGSTAALQALLADDLVALQGLARPKGTRLALYVGRGAAARVGLFDSTHASFAERLFTTLPVERFVLDVDDDPTGGFSALAYVPKDKSVALGLISTRTSRLEARDAILDRLDEAAACMDGDFMAICPQSGFADSGLTEEDQRRKLELVVSLSIRYWGFEA